MTPMQGTTAVELTVDQLAAAAGLTVRTVRSWTSRGLLPPPRLRGRTGLYGREHLARLEAVRDMLAAGYTLAAAEQVLAAAPAGVTAPGLEVYRALLHPWRPERPEGSEPPEVVDRDALADRLGVPLGDDRLARLEARGVVRVVDGRRVELLQPALLRAARQLASLGVPMAAVLDTQEVIGTHAEAMAQACVALFLDRVWEPFEAAGRPDDGWEDVRRAVDRALPLASQAVLVAFRQALTTAIRDVVDDRSARRRAESDGPSPA